MDALDLYSGLVSGLIDNQTGVMQSCIMFIFPNIFAIWTLIQLTKYRRKAESVKWLFGTERMNNLIVDQWLILSKTRGIATIANLIDQGAKNNAKKPDNNATDAVATFTISSLVLKLMNTAQAAIPRETREGFILNKSSENFQKQYVRSFGITLLPSFGCLNQRRSKDERLVNLHFIILPRFWVSSRQLLNASQQKWA